MDTKETPTHKAHPYFHAEILAENARCASVITVSARLNCICHIVRWGQTPLDDARQFQHQKVVELLEEHQEKLRQMTDEEKKSLFKGVYD